MNESELKLRSQKPAMDSATADEPKVASPPINGDKTGEDSPASFITLPVASKSAQSTMPPRNRYQLRRRVVLNPAKPKIDEDDAPNGADLSPADSSSVSSVNPDMLGDEIVVGTHGDGDKPSPLRVVSDTEDRDSTNLDDEEPVSHYPKRKRASQYSDLGEDKMDTSVNEEVNDIGTPRGSQGKPTPTSGRDSKIITLGYWRDSPIPHAKGKHAVIGFMDLRSM
ncbi:hypothetical protein NPX13_g5147 [Xylaria arbuscula]|uniref:Uncharacterized protein n=1 Tax=Xylaria arbuscula TaxID=114810 RepID=A0A9W8NEZ3_9PEZI|nr:hypothetical protein NPX13_g5147 [Xylaria arbuscula]